MLLIIALIFLLTKNQKIQPMEEILNIEKLEMEFNSMFNNQENEYVSTLYHIEEEKSGKYEI